MRAWLRGLPIRGSWFDPSPKSHLHPKRCVVCAHFRFVPRADARLVRAMGLVAGTLRSVDQAVGVVVLSLPTQDEEVRHEFPKGEFANRKGQESEIRSVVGVEDRRRQGKYCEAPLHYQSPETQVALPILSPK